MVMDHAAAGPIITTHTAGSVRLMLVDTAAEHHRPQGVADPGMGGTNGVVG